MLLTAGTLRGARILSPESVALMTTDRLTASQREGTEVFLEPDDGWGLGLAVPAIGSTAPLPCGIGWDGGIGTTWRSNPTSGVTGIALTQRAVTSPVETALMADFWTAVNAATQSTT
jgi:CubicO group peptidase (beta-lactamase class C family)